jgi:tetratricopeptide (TPR) repeat protein
VASPKRGSGYDALIEEGSKSWYVRDTLGFARGALALINGKADEAIGLLAPLTRNSNFTYRHHILGRAYERANLLQEAAVEYEWVVKRSRNAWELDSYIVPTECVLDQFRLAKVYEKLGNTDRARHWYEQFTEDWKDADSDIPELIEARERLAELKGESGPTETAAQ